MSTTAATHGVDEPVGRRRLLRWALWGAFLSGCFGLAWVRAVRNAQFWSDHEAHESRQKELLDLGFRRSDEVLSVLNSRPQSLHSLEAKLNGGQPFSLQASQDRSVAEWRDPVCGRVWKLDFRNGQYVGHSSHWGTGDVLRQYPQVRRADYRGVSEPIRWWIARSVPWAWLGFACAAILWAGRRKLLSELLMAGAMLSTMAWAVDPYYTLSLAGVLSNDRLFFGSVMLALSVAVAASQYAPQRGPFQFSLRTLFGVTTACAVLCSVSVALCLVVVVDALIGLGVYLALARRLRTAVASEPSNKRTR